VFISITCPHAVQDAAIGASDQTPTKSPSRKVLTFWTDWVDTMLRFLTAETSTIASTRAKSTPVHKVEVQARCAMLG
jgi:hypothetical protein